MKCDRCDNPATVHLIEIINGQKIEKHLCEHHALEEGVTIKVTSSPINELLEKFVLKHTSPAAAPTSVGGAVQQAGPVVAGGETDLVCEHCGLTFSEFRKRALLGCADCYTAFEPLLMPLLERAQEGASHHLGKVPRYAGSDQLRQQRLKQLRRELDKAVTSEQYERAARLRDEVRELESHK
ncbi:MAG: UvrB/UvrC motif-containing protein [Phycisphaerales bacterium]